MGEDLGLLKFDGARIRYEDSSRVIWELKVRDVAVIGEIMDDGAGLAITSFDHRWVFVLRGKKWFEAPIQAAGSEFLQDELKSHFGCDMTPQLFLTDLASRVIWPPSLAGGPLFDFRPSPPKTLLQLVVSLFGTRLESHFSGEVEKLLDEGADSA